MPVTGLSFLYEAAVQASLFQQVEGGRHGINKQTGYTAVEDIIVGFSDKRQKNL